MIIDVHAHLGKDFVFDLEQSENRLIDAYDKCKVDKAIIQPFISRPYIEDTQKAHDRISELVLLHPKRFYGMASINPHFREKDYEDEAVRCIKVLGFVGIKMNTIGHAVDPSSRDGMHVFDVAKNLNVPVMVHTGLGAPLASPIAVWKAVEQYPTVKTILAHTGGNESQQQALLLARKFDNVFLEPSWMPSVSIKLIVDAVGADKVMFSSDDVGNLEVALYTFRTMIKDAEKLDTVLSRTARMVYGI